MEHIHVLAAEIGRRPAGSEAEKRAADYITGVFSAAGYRVTTQPVERPGGGTSHNIIGRYPLVDYSNGYLLIGAHFDTVSQSPGANDNASGTGVVLTIAETLSGANLPIEFVGFTVEERQPSSPPGRMGLTIGSRTYVDNLGHPGVVKGMLSVDMIGNGPSVQLLRLHGADSSVRSELVAAAKALGIPYLESSKGDVSDHAPFARRGIPAAFLYSGSHPSYHKPSDTYSVVRRTSVDWTGQIVTRWIQVRLGVTR